MSKNFKPGGIFSSLSNEYIIPEYLKNSDGELKPITFTKNIDLKSIEDDYLKSFESELSKKSLVGFMMGEFIRDAKSKFSDELSSYLRKNLSSAGYEFKSDSEYLEFVKRRITRVGFEDRPDYFEFYIDRHENDGGFLIGCYSSKTQISPEFKGKIIITFGE